MMNPKDRESRFRWNGETMLGVALALVLALWLGPVGVPHARAEDPSTPSDQSSPSSSPSAATEPSATTDTQAVPSGDSGGATSAPASAQGYVAEIVDSAFVVGPAEFMALDLPPNPEGQRAAHLLGTVNVAK